MAGAAAKVQSCPVAAEELLEIPEYKTVWEGQAAHEAAEAPQADALGASDATTPVPLPAQLALAGEALVGHHTLAPVPVFESGTSTLLVPHLRWSTIAGCIC